MKATSLLREQHRRLERLLARVGAEPSLRLPLVLQLVEELMTHLAVEDHFFLCAVADATGIRVDAYRHAQAAVRNAVLQAVFVEDDDEVFADRIGELHLELTRHVRVLERDLFPLVESQVPAADLEAVGARMQAYWEAAVGTGMPPQPSHVHAAE